MTPFTTLMWKEWRDHRPAIVAYLAVAPMLLAIAFGVLPEDTWRHRSDLPAQVALIGFGIAALMFGADLVPGEIRRGKLALLARLPCDLDSAFVAKLAFLVAMLALFATWTWVNGAVAAVLLLDQGWTSPFAFQHLGDVGLPLLVGTSWIFAVSCWLPRGTLVLPAAAVALMILLAPTLAAFLLNPAMELRPREFESIEAWLAIAGVYVAACSFTVGWHHGGRLRSRLTWSLASAGVAMAPVWTWSTLRVAEYRHLDPTEASFRLVATAIGAGENHAFLNGYHLLRGAENSPTPQEFGGSHPMIVDLRTGSWREEGCPGDLFWFLGHGWQRTTADVVLLIEDQHDSGVPIASQFVDAFDAATGAALQGDQWKKFLRRERGEDPVHPGQWNMALLPDGRRAWSSGRKIHVQDVEGRPTEMHCDVDERWQWPIGQGFLGESEYYFDCTRERAFRKRDAGEVLVIRAGKWVVRKTLPGSGQSVSLWDPTTGEEARLPAGLEEFIGLHPDGRLIVIRRASKPDETSSPGALVLLDPESGERRELNLPPDLSKSLHFSLSSWRHPQVTAAGDMLLGFYEHDTKRQWLARFDPRTDDLVVIGPFRSVFPDILGALDRNTVFFVEDGRRLIRAHFDGRPPEVLFPR